MNVTPPPIQIVSKPAGVDRSNAQPKIHAAKRAMLAIVVAWFASSVLFFAWSYFGAYGLGIDLRDGRYLFGSTIYSPGQMVSFAAWKGLISVVTIAPVFIFGLIACFAVWFATSDRS